MYSQETVQPCLLEIVSYFGGSVSAAEMGVGGTAAAPGMGAGTQLTTPSRAPRPPSGDSSSKETSSKGKTLLVSASKTSSGSKALPKGTQRLYPQGSETNELDELKAMIQAPSARDMTAADASVEAATDASRAAADRTPAKSAALSVDVQSSSKGTGTGKSPARRLSTVAENGADNAGGKGNSKGGDNGGGSKGGNTKGGGSPVRAGSPGVAADPAQNGLPYSEDALKQIESRWLAEAEQWEVMAAAVPLDFDRFLGNAIRRVSPTKGELKDLIQIWDKDNKGLKKVDFRRQMRGTNVTGLKLTASNQDIDRLFDSVTGGGGAAVASVKDITALLWPIAAKAGVPDPKIEEYLAKASGCRDQAALLLKALDALKSTENVEIQLRSLRGGSAPVLAQIGALLIKRNMKVGEVVSKWGDVDHASFREHVRALGVVAEAADIDYVFDMIDDDGGGTLDADELKDGMKMLVESSKKNDSSLGGLEKQAAALRKVAVAEMAALHKRETQREQRLAVEAEEARKAEVARLEAEEAATAALAEKEKEKLAAKAAEKAAFLKQVDEPPRFLFDQKKAATH